MAYFIEIVELVNSEDHIFIKIFKAWFYFNLFYLEGQNGPNN